MPNNSSEVDVRSLSDDDYRKLLMHRFLEAVRPFNKRDGNDIDRMQLTLALYKVKITLEYEYHGFKRAIAEQIADTVIRHRNDSQLVQFKAINKLLREIQDG